MTPTAIVRLTEIDPRDVQSATQRLRLELQDLKKHPDKATKIREVSAMPHPAPGTEPPSEMSQSDSNLLRAVMAAAQEHGKSEGRAVTKFQLGTMSTVVTVLWGITMAFAASAWSDMKARVAKHDEQIQVILQDSQASKVREADVVRRLDKLDQKQDTLLDKVTDLSQKVSELKPR